MRVTDSLRYQSYSTNLAAIKEQLARYTEEISSKQKILSPSDDPVGSETYIQLTAQQDSNTQYLSNLSTLSTLGGTIETSVNSISDILTAAAELATTMASDTVDSTSRTSAATEVEGYIEELVSLGNTKTGNTYIFGGTNSSTPAYTLNADYSVTYNGSTSTTSIQVSNGQTMKVGMTGDEAFGSGTSSIFAALKDLKTALENNDTTAVSSALDSINSAVDLTANNLSKIGVYTGAISNTTDKLTAQNTQLTTTMSDIMSCDLVAVYSDYTNLNTAYQAALSILTKMQSTSILNYM
jgi:flagellar hook-associated protein 3 FlgL